jgi:hypothetical protein
MELLNTRMFNWQKGQPSGLAKHMDVIILNNDCIIYNKSLELSKTIFINTRLNEKLIIYFIDNILPKLSTPINLIISGEDYTFPNNIDKRMNGITDNRFKTLGQHKFINKMFVENLDENIENALPIPLGINPRECPITNDYFLKFENIDSNKPLKFTNFNRTRDGKGQWEERGYVNNLCENSWSNFFITNEHKNHDEYLKTMGKYLFTICVHGGGLDVNPKLWEALLIGVIPIIKENKPYSDIYERLDFPVVIVKEWNVNTINENDLTIWYNKYYNYFTNNKKRKEMLNYLSLDYWVNYVNNFGV